MVHINSSTFIFYQDLLLKYEVDFPNGRDRFLKWFSWLLIIWPCWLSQWVLSSGEHYIGEASLLLQRLPSATTISHLLLCLISLFSFHPQWNWCIGKSWGFGRKCPLLNWASIPVRCKWKMMIRKDFCCQLFCGHPENRWQNVCSYSRWCNINWKCKKHRLFPLSDNFSFLRAPTPGIFTQWIWALWHYGMRPCWNSFLFSMHSSSVSI